MMHATEIQTSAGSYMAVIRATILFCEVCGYPNNKSPQWAAIN